MRILLPVRKNILAGESDSLWWVIRSCFGVMLARFYFGKFASIKSELAIFVSRLPLHSWLEKWDMGISLFVTDGR